MCRRHSLDCNLNCMMNVEQLPEPFGFSSLMGKRCDLMHNLPYLAAEGTASGSAVFEPTNHIAMQSRAEPCRGRSYVSCAYHLVRRSVFRPSLVHGVVPESHTSVTRRAGSYLALRVGCHLHLLQFFKLWPSKLPGRLQPLSDDFAKNAADGKSQTIFYLAGCLRLMLGVQWSLRGSLAGTFPDTSVINA